jgi:hypothetical protein
MTEEVTQENFDESAEVLAKYLKLYGNSVISYME